MADKVKEIQGQDPRGNVYADLNPVLYSAETSVSGAYVLSSWACALYADTLSGGLRGKDVLDLGCGYGTTTSVLANFGPRRIVAVDNAAAMLTLMEQVMCGDLESLADWLKEKDAKEVLGGLFESTWRHYVRRRKEFDEGIFKRNGGELVLQTMSSTEISPENIGTFDVIVGNNFLHWPVNQKKAELKKQYPEHPEPYLTHRAVIAAVEPISHVMRKGAVAILMEPKDFMNDDLNSKNEKDLDSHTFVSQPLFKKFHTVFNRLLKERHGIDRAVPSTAGLFLTSQLSELFAMSGLKLNRIAHFEYAFNCDPVDAMYVRLPLVLGNIAISFADKIALGKATMEEFRKTVTSEELAQPMQAQYFYICAEKV